MPVKNLVPETITIKNPKSTNTIHILNCLNLIERLNEQMLQLANDVSYIKKWIAKHEEEELKLKRSGWFY